MSKTVTDNAVNGTHGEVGTDTVFLTPSLGEPVALPEGLSLSSAEFSRIGDNLSLTWPDGTKVVINNYFGQGSLPDIVSLSGTQVDGTLVSMLAGDVAGEAPPTAAETDANVPIGHVESSTGTIMVTHADNTRGELEVGDPVYQGDVLETSQNSAVGVVLVDETTFSMAENGILMLDEMSYDPSSEEGTLSLSVVKGVFAFVSGQISKSSPDAMSIETPVARIGVNGTQVGIDIPDGENLNVVLMEEADGFTGEVIVENNGGTVVMNSANQTTAVSGLEIVPAPVTLLSQANMIETFGAALKH
ncbi:MAG: FecR domain-containing protein, partial [Rhodospirillales bacterium]|nr:FecR domain-containing protein [Rhodospirillales bacterium]